MVAKKAKIVGFEIVLLLRGHQCIVVLEVNSNPTKFLTYMVDNDKEMKASHILCSTNLNVAIVTFCRGGMATFRRSAFFQYSHSTLSISRVVLLRNTISICEPRNTLFPMGRP
jgi:hypothetical protein